MTQRDTTSVRQAVAAALGEGRTRAGHRRVVLAVSGGVDSMVLLDAAVATTSLDRLLVATFDHGTGPTAAAARTFVEQRATLGTSASAIVARC